MLTRTVQSNFVSSPCLACQAIAGTTCEPFHYDSVLWLLTVIVFLSPVMNRMTLIRWCMLRMAQMDAMMYFQLFSLCGCALMCNMNFKFCVRTYSNCKNATIYSSVAHNIHGAYVSCVLFVYIHV